MSYIVYGIKNCNTMKKSFGWLKEHQVDYEFYDFKKRGITRGKLEDWADQLGWEALINKRGLTWKKLPETVRAGITDRNAAIAILMEKTSMIKRPLIERAGKIIQLGYDELAFKKL